MIYRFILSGDNVQGVQLRESFVKAANHRQLKGQIRNLPNGEVEALFLCSGNEEDISECINESFARLGEKGLLDEEEVKSIRINGEKIDSFYPSSLSDEDTEKYLEGNKFLLVREHELKENVWALQGAGRVFLVAAEKVDSLLGYKKKEVIGRLESVKKELLYMQSNYENVDDPVCLRQFIADPLIDLTAGSSEEEDLIRGLIELYYEYVTYKREGKRSIEGKNEIASKIERLATEIDWHIERLNNQKKPMR